MSYQVFRIDNEAQIWTKLDANSQSSGKITFIFDDPVRGPQQYGQIRALGNKDFPQLLMLDSSEMVGGSLSIRTAPTQGTFSFIGGKAKGNPMGLTAKSTNVTVTSRIDVKPPATLVNSDNSVSGNQLGISCLILQRYGTANVQPKNQTYIAEFYQDTIFPDEMVSIKFGTSYGLGLIWGFKSATGNPYGTDMRGYIGMDLYVTDVRIAMEWDSTGNCFSEHNHTVAETLTATTVSATTYVGLPAFDPAVLDPITLDTVNDRVGINQVTPTEALDVTGNIKSSGTITGNTVSATTYIGLPSSSVLPITLDTVNNRVGINKTSPSVTLDVDGSCFISGATTIDDTFVVQNSSPFSTLGMTCNPTTGMTNVVDLSATGTVSAGTVSATTYVGLPAFDPAVLDPITLNSTLNRVGINTASPGYNLDINGDCYIDQDLSVGTMVNVNGAYVNSGNGTPESVVTAPVGSMYMRRDGASGTTLYTKILGTSATGWQPLVSSSKTVLSSGVKNSPLIPAGTISTTVFVDTQIPIAIGTYMLSMGAWGRKPSATSVTNGYVLQFGFTTGTTITVGRNAGLLINNSNIAMSFTSYTSLITEMYGMRAAVLKVTSAGTNLSFGWYVTGTGSANTPAGTFTIEYDYVLEKVA